MSACLIQLICDEEYIYTGMHVHVYIMPCIHAYTCTYLHIRSIQARIYNSTYSNAFAFKKEGRFANLDRHEIKTRIHERLHICVYIYIYIYICMYVCSWFGHMCTRVQRHVYLCTYVCMYVCMYVCIYVYCREPCNTYIRVYIQIYAHTFTCTDHTYIQIIHTYRSCKSYIHTYMHTWRS